MALRITKKRDSGDVYLVTLFALILASLIAYSGGFSENANTVQITGYTIKACCAYTDINHQSAYRELDIPASIPASLNGQQIFYSTCIQKQRYDPAIRGLALDQVNTQLGNCPICGNNILDPEELCDKTKFSPDTYARQPRATQPVCSPNCQTVTYQSTFLGRIRNLLRAIP